MEDNRPKQYGKLGSIQEAGYKELGGKSFKGEQATYCIDLMIVVMLVVRIFNYLLKCIWLQLNRAINLINRIFQKFDVSLENLVIAI